MSAIRRKFTRRVIRKKMKESIGKGEIKISRRAFLGGLFATGVLSFVKGTYTGETAPDESYELERGRFLSIRTVHSREVNGKKIPVFILSPVYLDAKKDATLIKLPPEGSQILIDYHSIDYLKDRLKGHSVVLFHLPSQENDARTVSEELKKNNNDVKLVKLPKELEDEIQKDKSFVTLLKSAIATIGSVTPLAALRYATKSKTSDPIRISLNRREFLKLAALTGVLGYVGASANYLAKTISHTATVLGREGAKPDVELIFHPTGGGRYLYHLWNEIPKHADTTKEVIAVFRAPHIPPGKIAYYFIRGLSGRRS